MHNATSIAINNSKYSQRGKYSGVTKINCMHLSLIFIECVLKMKFALFFCFFFYESSFFGIHLKRLTSINKIFVQLCLTNSMKNASFTNIQYSFFVQHFCVCFHLLCLNFLAYTPYTTCLKEKVFCQKYSKNYFTLAWMMF